MRILGCDPGSAKIGISVLDGEELLHCDRLMFASKNMKFNEDLNYVLSKAYHEFLRLAHLYRITHVCGEIVPANRGFASKDKVVSVATALKVLAIQFELPYQGIFPVSVKKTMQIKENSNKTTKTKIPERNRLLELYPNFFEMFPKIAQNNWDCFDSILIARTALIKNNWIYPQSSAYTRREW